jgi:hypothetical protein
MTAATIVYILFAIAAGDVPDLAPLAVYDDRPACDTAATKIAGALADGHGSRIFICVSSDSLAELADKNPPPGVDAK